MSRISNLLRHANQLGSRANSPAISATPHPLSSDLYDPDNLDGLAATMAAFERMENTNHIPDPMGRHREPKSIYSPAAASRIRREAPRKRNQPVRTGDAGPGASSLYQAGIRTPHWPKYDPNG